MAQQTPFYALKKGTLIKLARCAYTYWFHCEPLCKLSSKNNQADEVGASKASMSAKYWLLLTCDILPNS